MKLLHVTGLRDLFGITGKEHNIKRVVFLAHSDVLLQNSARIPSSVPLSADFSTATRGGTLWAQSSEEANEDINFSAVLKTLLGNQFF